MKAPRALLAALGPLLALTLAACGEPDPPALAVGPVAYSSEQLLGISESRRATLANLTAFALAVADSSTAELGAPLVGRWEDDLLLDLFAADLTLAKNQVEDDVLLARYRTDPELELTVRHILFFSERWRTDDVRAEARAKAGRALEALRGGADFAETAAALSEEPGAEGRQGLLTPGREGAWVDEFWAAATALEVGEMSPVTETEYGYHILRLEGLDTVAFEEARSRVALDVADRIEDPRAVLDGWLDTVAGAIEVAGGAAGTEGGEGTTVLATWTLPGGEEGSLTLDDFRAWAATQPAAWAGHEGGADPGLFEGLVRELVRRHLGLQEAERRGLAVGEAERARLERRWDDQVYQWSATLGFTGGVGPQGVASAALTALSKTGQGADLARAALDERAPLLRALHNVRMPDSSG